MHTFTQTMASYQPLAKNELDEEVKFQAASKDYEEFDLANEMDELEKFLKVAPSVSKAAITLNTNDEKGAGDATSKALIENGQVNGNTSSRENSAEKETVVLEERREEPEDQAAIEENEEEADEDEDEAENEQ